MLKNVQAIMENKVVRFLSQDFWLLSAECPLDDEGWEYVEEKILSPLRRLVCEEKGHSYKEGSCVLCKESKRVELAGITGIEL